MLELIGLTRRFGDLLALDDVSFVVPAGSIVGFVGPNGAGKTTAMRIALGVLRPDAGEVKWRGRRVDAAMRRRFGYMPEERGLYPKMRVLEQLVYLARLHGLGPADARRRASEAVELLGVAVRSKDRLEKLSLGNQQRVQLAAALVHEPDVLILDEPFSGLDPVGVDALSAILRSQADERGAPVVFSSHQLELVERLCDAVVLIDRGSIVAHGAIEELRASRSRRLVRIELTGAQERWWDVVEGVALVEPLPDEGGVFELTQGADDQRLLDVARRAGQVHLFAPVLPTLAELFREVVRA